MKEKVIKQVVWGLFLTLCAAVSGHLLGAYWAPGLALGVVYYASPNTGDSLSALDPAEVHTLWQKGVDVFEQTEDFFTPMEGGQNAIIETVTDTSKGRGQSIRFETMSGFYKEPHRGDQLFETSADFEKIRIQGDTLAVDFLRHGVRFTERMEELLGMRGEIVSGLNVETGKWLGRLKSEEMFMMFVNSLPATNTVYAGGKTLDTLASVDTLSYNEVLGLNAQLKRLGGLPGQIATSKNGQPIFKNTVVATTDALYSLDLDSNFRSILATTRSEEDAKTIFEGGYTNLKGNIIKEYMPKDHDGVGAIGSPLAAKAAVGAVITAGTAAFDILGGGDASAALETDILFFKYFDNYAYTFLVTDAIAQDALTHYVIIVNPPNDPSNPNKWGLYSYTTGNNGNKITVTGRLAGSASGIANTSLGNITWNGTINTTEHPIGATILQCNSKAQIFGYSLLLGKRAARRGYGKYRNKYSTQDHEGGFVMDRYVTSVFGQAPRKDRIHRVPGALVLIHAIKYAGIPTPTTT
jgi:hypothetical protein